MKFSKKRIAILIVILIVGGYYGVKAIFKNPADNLIIERVAMGNIVQEVSETGTIKAVEEVKMGFKTAGQIKEINVKEGDVVEKGAILAKLDINQLYTQLQQAQASLTVAQIQYNKLAQNDVDASQQQLDDYYQDSLNSLDDAYLKAYNAYNSADTIRDSYFTNKDQDGITVSDNVAIISENVPKIKTSLSSAISSLSNISEALKNIRESCESQSYSAKVSSADKTILDNQRSYIIASLADVTGDQQNINLQKIDLQKKQNNLEYYGAKVEETRAQIVLLQTQISEASLRSPIKGMVTAVDKKVGEIVQTTETPISLISLDPYQIKVDIYEEDIVKVAIGNTVEIKVAAFSGETLLGKVIFINPAEKIVDGVVYYETTIAFDQAKDGLRPGMTADLVIKTASKENALFITKDAISENGRKTVEVYKDGKSEIREIQTGLEGNDNRVEIISGLSEGEQVVIK